MRLVKLLNGTDDLEINAEQFEKLLKKLIFKLKLFELN
jgi:hypothetical protein